MTAEEKAARAKQLKENKKAKRRAER